MKFNVVLDPTEAEALENAKEAILCYIEGLKNLNKIRSNFGEN